MAGLWVRSQGVRSALPVKNVRKMDLMEFEMYGHKLHYLTFRH